MTYSQAFSQGVEILIFIHMKSVKEFYKYLSIPKIAEGLNMPVPSVKRLVEMLKKADLIVSKTGVAGGLALAQPVDKISLLDILQAIEGKKSLFNIYQEFNLDEFPDKDEVIVLLKNSQQLFQNIEDTAFNSLQSTSLLDLFAGT